MNSYTEQPPHLLIDGYIAKTFGPLDAPAYHSTLLMRSPNLVQPYNHPGYPGVFFAAAPELPSQPPSSWVIDYADRNYGTVIKQHKWIARNQSDFLRPPIFFVNRNGALGLPLNEAAGGNCMSLHGANKPAPLMNCSTHAQIRINWHGYQPWDEQIMVRTQAQGGQEIILLEKFATHVAKKVKKFMVQVGRQPNNNREQFIGGHGGIAPEDVILIGVVHVSQGSMMPILQLNRFVF